MFSKTSVIKTIRCSIAASAFLISTALLATETVSPRHETNASTTRGDSIDDPGIWLHPHDPAKSLIVGTNKKSGYSLYTLTGQSIFTDDRVAFNNIDVRYGYTLPDGRKIDLIVASDKHNKAFHVMGFSDQHTEPEILMEPVAVANRAYGICLYHSALTDKFYVFVTGRDGKVLQYSLYNENDKIQARLVRSVALASSVEGCVADDEYGELYVGEEEVGIWNMGAEPTVKEAPRMVAAIDNSEFLSADIEGLTIYSTGNGDGYLMASVQSRDEFAVFERRSPNRYLYSFKIGAGVDPITGRKIDAVSHTDGIDIISTNLGSVFPYGAFIAQDDKNHADEDNKTQGQNFKIVPVEEISRVAPFTFKLDNAWDPRAPKRVRR